MRNNPVPIFAPPLFPLPTYRPLLFTLPTFLRSRFCRSRFPRPLLFPPLLFRSQLFYAPYFFRPRNITPKLTLSARTILRNRRQSDRRRKPNHRKAKSGRENETTDKLKKCETAKKPAPRKTGGNEAAAPSRVSIRGEQAGRIRRNRPLISADSMRLRLVLRARRQKQSR